MKILGVTSAPLVDALRPWYDQVDWQADPALAYAKGLQDGVELGREQVDREIAAALAWALSAGQATDYGQAVRIHAAAVDARAARARADGRAAA